MLKGKLFQISEWSCWLSVVKTESHENSGDLVTDVLF